MRRSRDHDQWIGELDEIAAMVQGIALLSERGEDDLVLQRRLPVVIGAIARTAHARLNELARRTDEES